MTLMTEHEAVAPPSLAEFVGQEPVKQRLAVHIEAAKRARRPLPHVLLMTDPGMGKSTLARLIADSFSEPMVEITQPSGTDELLEKLYELEGGVLFIDEVHRWSKTQQRNLLTLCEEGYIDTRYGREKFPWLTVIAATTEPQELEQPFIDRFPIRPSFTPYTAEDMRVIIAGMAARTGVELTDEAIDVLAGACTGCPRIARHLVLDAKALGDSPTGEEILAFAQIAPDGLTVEHLDYLNMLMSCQGGRAGLDVLVNRLRSHNKVLRGLERILLDRGYIAYDSRGRVLTAAGRRRLSQGPE